MRRRTAILLAAAAIVTSAALGWYLFLRGPSSPGDLAAFLPNKDGTLLFADVGAMRQSGFLNLIAGSKTAEEQDYRDFVQQSGFDYRHDLDAVAATMRGDQIFFALRGRFDWDKLFAYAKRRGGSCKGSYCVADGSQPKRRVSFHKLAGNLMGMAVSQDDMAAYQVSENASKPNPFTPDSPVWVMLPAPVLHDTEAFPAGIRSFAMALENSDRAIFTAGPDGDHLKVSLSVTCKDVESASALMVQLETTTNTLRKLFAREHQQPNPADLSGVLVAGVFRRDDRKVLGDWPIQKAFLDSVSGANH